MPELSNSTADRWSCCPANNAPSGQHGTNSARPETAPRSAITTFAYTNYRGERSVRRALPFRIRFGSTDYHPKPQWLMDAFDIDKKANRTFALADCDFTQRGDAAEALAEAHRQVEALKTAYINATKHNPNFPDLSTVPQDWFVLILEHRHTPIVHRGDRHDPFSQERNGRDPWNCALQHVTGGKMTEGSGETPAAALSAAVSNVELTWLEVAEER